jgi:ERCC4-related helicase
LNPELIDQIVLVVLDEAHKGVGDYAYTAIVKRLSYKTRIIALSATPGNNLE